VKTLRLLACAILLGAAACDDSPSDPGPGGSDEYLAGGGRALDADAFVGGPEASGPVTARTEPGQPDIAPAYAAIFYSEWNCFGAPFVRAVTSQDEWSGWWKTARSCEPVYEVLPGDGTKEPPPQRTDATDPGLPTKPDPYDPTVPPTVDFARSTVIAIGLEEAKGWGRRVQVLDVSTSGGTTTVRYEVLAPGDDCTRMLMMPIDPDAVPSSPVIAVLVRAPVGAKVVGQRTDSVWHCVWEPDPKEPLTLYYTDATCDLGDGEVVIREQERWAAWLDAAIACERARWDSPTEPPLPKDLPVTRTADATDQAEPWKGWLSPAVDFATHAVVILRAPAQTRWGGGVWLTAFAARAGGTTIDYAIMSPGRDCPAIEDGAAVRPTTAIRLPLPLPAPVSFRRKVETIDCRWETKPVPTDGGGSAAGSGGTVTVTPRATSVRSGG
jgi:hypothetical protein